MSDAEDTSDPSTAEVGGLEEVLPEPLLPLYARYERIEEFRATHGDTYVGILEAIVALVLIGGYLYWLYLFFLAG